MKLLFRVSVIILLTGFSYSYAQKRSGVIRPTIGRNIPLEYEVKSLSELEKIFTRKAGDIVARLEDYSCAKRRIIEDGEKSGWDEAKLRKKIADIDTSILTFYVEITAKGSAELAEVKKWKFEITDGERSFVPEVFGGKGGADVLEIKGKSPVIWHNYVTLVVKQFNITSSTRFLRLTAINAKGVKSIVEWRFK